MEYVASIATMCSSWVFFQYLTCGVLCLLIITQLYLSFSRHRLPPGPSGLPFIGNVLQLDLNSPHVQLTEWSCRHGEVFRIACYGEQVIVLNSHRAVHEAFIGRGDDMSGRPYMFRHLFFNDFRYNVTLHTFSERWLKLKKRVLNSMRMYGDGLRTLEDISLSVSKDLVTIISNFNGKAFDPHSHFFSTFANVIFSVVYGRKMEDKELKTLLSLDRIHYLSPVGKGVELDMLPWLLYLPFPFYNKMKAKQRQTISFFDQIVNDQKGGYPDGPPTCVLHALLKLKRQEEKLGVKPLLADRDMMAVTADLIFAGVATSTSGLLSIVLLCATFPEIQARIYREIYDIIGDRDPRLTDRQEMHYLEAAILETLRYVTPAPVGVPHATVRDTSIQGYHIPKNTRVVANLWSLHHDEHFWQDPWCFKPERFLDGQGRLLTPSHECRRRLMSFGTGRRVCAGEVLAKNRLFLIVACLLQRFEFVLPKEDRTHYHHDPRTFRRGLIIFPQRFKVCANPR